MLKWYFIFLTYLKLLSAYRILVAFPVPGGSHSILGEGYVRHLSNAGHEVTYISPVMQNKSSSNVRRIDVSSNLKLYSYDDVFNIEKIMKKEIDLNDFYYAKNMMLDIANATLANLNVKKLMEDPKERFDAVIVDWLYTEIYSGFSLLFDCPLIWASSMDPHAMVYSLIDELPNPAYTAGHFSSKHPPFTFWERIKELGQIAYIMNVVRILRPKETQIFNEGFNNIAKKRDRQFVHLNEMRYKGSLMLGNSHVSFGQPLRTPPNYKPILGYHIPEILTPLPEVIQNIMDRSTQGVIYFSLGSLLRGKSFPMHIKRDLLKLFSELPQTVLWKLEEPLSELPHNVHVVEWAPQTSILAHPNCVLFITHGGLLSTTEAVHFAVPIIGVPAFADQNLNVDRAVRKGFGRKVSLCMDFVENLKNEIGYVLSDQRYREKAREISWIYHHRPASPGAELVHWVEHVIQTGGAPHLHSPALLVPFYQKCYLDLAAVVIVAITLATITTRLLKHKRVDNVKKNN